MLQMAQYLALNNM